MDKGDDPYQILGLSKSDDDTTITITTTTIKKAYRELARIYHPDKNNHADAGTKFAKISHAYDILKDDESRHSYDLSQKHNNQKGYDPNGPTYSSSSSPRATPTTTTPSTTKRTSTTHHYRTPMTTTTRRTTIPTRKTYHNNNTNYKSTDAYNGGDIDDTIQSMSSKERTVINPITKCKEVITEITVTKFDGSVEVRTEKRQQQPTHQKNGDNTMKIRTPKSNNTKESTNIDIKKKKDKKKKKKAVKKVEKDDEQQQPIPIGQNNISFMNNSPTSIATDLYTTIPMPSSTSSNTTKTTKKKKKVIPSATKELMMPSSNSTNTSTVSTKPKRKTQKTKLVHHRTTNNKSTNSTIDDDVQSMSTKERTVLNPLTKRKEIIIETTVTKFDGSVEVRTERKQF